MSTIMGFEPTISCTESTHCIDCANMTNAFLGNIYYTNADNSLLSKYAELTAVSTPFDILAITEIKPKHGEQPSRELLEIPGYNSFFSKCDEPQTRGVCIYVKQGIHAEIYHDATTEQYKDAVWVQLLTSGIKTIIGCVYRSGSPAIAQAHDNKLQSVLKHISQLNFAHHIVVGDFNYNRITWDPDPVAVEDFSGTSPETQFIECIRDTYLYQHVTEATRYRQGQRPSQLDLLFTREEGAVSSLTFGPHLGNSDHISLHVEFKLNYTLQKKNRVVYHYDKADYGKMSVELFEFPWDDFLEDLNADEAMNLFEDKLRAAIAKYIPFHTITENDKPTPPWMNRVTLRRIRKKHHAWIRFLNTKDRQDYQAYCQVRNEAGRAVKEARKSFERKLAAECRTNNKGLWRYINSRLHNKSKIQKLRRTDGTLTASDLEAAETLSDQFFSVFTQEDMSDIPVIPEKPLQTTAVSTFNITEQHVEKILKKLKIDKTPGIDGMHPRILKELATVIKTPLTLIYKKTIAESHLPSQWKDAIISPIYKKGDRFKPSNYRPVSLTSIVCKVLERIIVDQLAKHVKDNLLQCKQQHGFTPGKSTVTNLLEALNIWSEALMHGIPVDVLYLDYAKAFDSVPHERLLRRVRSFGITDLALAWIQSFLLNRRQKVSVNGEHSTWKPVVSGIPQGSVLGPFLFLLFVSDVPNQVSNFISLFADDTKLFEVLVDVSGSTTSLQADLNNLLAWSNKMQLRFHPDKCHILHLGSSNPNKEYHMNDNQGQQHVLSTSTAERDLGVLVDSKLTFSTHVEQVTKKANRLLGCIAHTFKHMDKDSFVLLYKSTVRPILEYASSVWSPHLKKDIVMLENVQRRATRLLPELRHLPYHDRLKALDLPTLKFRRLRTDLIQCFKILKMIDEVDSGTYCSMCPNKSMFEPARLTATRGHTMKLQVMEAKGPRKHFFSTRVIPMWNKLSQETVDSTTVNQFKSGLKKDLKGHPSYYHAYD